MKVVHVVSNIHDEAQGPAYTVPRLCESIAQQDAEVEIHTLMPLPERPIKNVGLQGYSAWPFLSRLGISPKMYRGLVQSNANIIHNHLLWMMPNVYTGLAARKAKKILITSPRGTLSQWSLNRSKYTKQLIWHLGQSKAILDAACIHVTAESELEEVRALGIRQPVAIIPNGIELPESLSVKTGDDRRKLVFVSRVHPKKGLEMLIHAWSHVHQHYPAWDLDIYGPASDDYLENLLALSQKLNVARLYFKGPVYANEKRKVYERADLFILPTHNENFGIVVAEALSYAVPAIVTKGAPWSGLERESCGWWCDISTEALSATLQTALALPMESLREIGRNGRAWIDREFSWQVIGEQMFATYSWLLHGGPRPDCIDPALSEKK